MNGDTFSRADRPLPSSSGVAPRESALSWTLLLWLAAAATLVISPFWFLGNASGHDFQFHLASWMEVIRQWHQGILYPRWAEWANFGFGEPRFIFYPPLSWLLGAALGSILPWRMVPGAFIWLALILSGVTMHGLARRWLSPRDAIAAAVFFAVNPYHLIIVYYRSDFAELLASALFPALILSAIDMGRKGWNRVPAFAFVFALIWLANGPAAVIATYTIAIVVLVEYFLERSPRVFATTAAGGALGLSLAAFYIFPAWFEERWVDIAGALAPQLEPWNNFIFTHADDPEFVIFNWKVSAVALFAFALFGISAVIAARKRKSAPEMFWPLFVTGATSILLMFPYTVALWKFAPELKFVQFPWRWLLSLDVSAVLFFAAAAASLRRRWLAWSAIAISLAALGAWMMTNNWWDSQDAPFLASSIDSGRGYEGADEYVPLGSDRYSLPDVSPIVAALDADSQKPVPDDAAHLRVEHWDAQYKSLRSESPQSFILALKLFPYPAWHATVNGTPVPLDPLGDAGQASLQVPAGTSRVELHFVRTPDRTAGGVISLFAALGFLAFWRKTRRANSPPA